LCTLDGSRTIINNFIEHYLPIHVTQNWLNTVSGKARFCWDITGIQVGFNDIIHSYLRAYPKRIGPILLLTLLDLFKLNVSTYPTIITSIELLYVAAMMVDKLNNVASVAKLQQESYPGPVLLTAAYSARQYALAIINTYDVGLSLQAKTTALHHLGNYLYQHGIYLALDYWHEGQGSLHTNIKGLIQHLKKNFTALYFSLLGKIILDHQTYYESAKVACLVDLMENLAIAYRLCELINDASGEQEINPRVRWLKTNDHGFEKKLNEEYLKVIHRLYVLCKQLPEAIGKDLIENAATLLGFVTDLPVKM
jgi:hypothetical protein